MHHTGWPWWSVVPRRGAAAVISPRTASARANAENGKGLMAQWAWLTLAVATSGGLRQHLRFSARRREQPRPNPHADSSVGVCLHLASSDLVRWTPTCAASMEAASHCGWGKRQRWCNVDMSCTVSHVRFQLACLQPRQHVSAQRLLLPAHEQSARPEGQRSNRCECERAWTQHVIARGWHALAPHHLPSCSRRLSGVSCDSHLNASV